MDDALDPGDERRARRFRIVVRLVLYPVALGLIALAWQQYHGGASQGHVFRIGHWSGVTSQGQAIRARTGDELLTSFNTELVERCSDGSAFIARWTPGQRHFVQQGDDFRARYTVLDRDDSGKPVEYDYRIQGRTGAHPRATIREQVSWTAGGGRVRCDSGPVTFALHRSP